MRKLFIGFWLVVLSILPVLLQPGPALAASGGGCQRSTVNGADVSPCISFRASGPALYLDGYVNSTGGRSCLRIDVYLLLNGRLTPRLQSTQVGGPAYVQPYRYNVSSSPGQTARTVWRLFTCAGGGLGEAHSLEQRFP